MIDRYGIKYWSIVCNQSGYLFDLYIYIGEFYYYNSDVVVQNTFSVFLYKQRDLAHSKNFRRDSFESLATDLMSECHRLQNSA